MCWAGVQKKRGTGKTGLPGKKMPPGADAPPGVWKAKKGKRQNILPWVSDLPLEGQLGRQGREKGKVVKEVEA